MLSCCSCSCSFYCSLPLCFLCPGEVAPLECNLDALNGISYTKGCYIGQERNSYTHYRGIIRRRMMPVRLKGLDEASSKCCRSSFLAIESTRP